MSGNYILAHDLGTSGNKATLFDGEGNLIASAFAGYSTRYPHPNHAEQDANEWWRAVGVSSRELLGRSGIAADEIAAVGFSAMMAACLPVDEQGEALAPCIIWQDQRASVENQFMIDRCGFKRIYQISGQRPSAGNSAPKYLWLRDHAPELWRRTYKLLMPKDYVVHKLTGVFASDYSDASHTMLFDLERRDWSVELLAEVGIERGILPDLFPSPTVVGEVTDAAAAFTGLKSGTPVVIGAGDGGAAGAGAGVIEPGTAYCVIGTSAWASVATDAPIHDRLERTMTFCHAHPERYIPTGSMQAAGGARQWVWGHLGGDGVDLDAAAAGVPAGSNGVVFLPYLMGERSPWWNPQARGAFVGLSMAHGRGEMARAVLEGVAIGLRQIVFALRESCPQIDSVRLIGGGGKSNLWQQIVADVLGMPVHLLELQGEATSWGAAVTAGVAIGQWEWEKAAERGSVRRTIEPNLANAFRYAELAEIYEETYRALVPTYDRLARFAGTQ